MQPPHISLQSAYGIEETIKQSKSKLHYKDLLKYFCWLTKASELYAFSLKTYDLEMALMVAEFTNMDPKEYLPYI